MAEESDLMRQFAAIASQMRPIAVDTGVNQRTSPLDEGMLNKQTGFLKSVTHFAMITRFPSHFVPMLHKMTADEIDEYLDTIAPRR